MEETKSCPEPWPCHCENSPFLDKDHDHILTSNLQIVGNNELWKMLSKCPKFRYPKLLIFNSAKNYIIKCTKECMSAYCIKNASVTKRMED